MKPETKYYFAQLVAIPAVGLPTVLGAIFLGGLLAKLTGADGPIGMCVIHQVLGRLGLLPRGAWRVYPNAGSWGGYLKKTGAL